MDILEENEKNGKGGMAGGLYKEVPLRLSSGLPRQMPVRGMFRAWHVPFLFLPRGAHLVPLRGAVGGLGVFVTTSRKREARAMKIVIVDRRKGVVGMLLRKLYGIRKVAEP